MLSRFLSTANPLNKYCVHALPRASISTQAENIPTLYGWDMSYFSVKLKHYFEVKGIPFNMHRMNLYDFHNVQKRIGATVMPVVVMPNGEWLQDSRNIIDKFEEQYPNNSIFPNDPIKRFVSCLLEAWGDEFWIPMAMHYRWSFPESNNVKFFKEEAGKYMLPYCPWFLQDMAANKPVNTLKEFLPVVGVIPEQYNMLEEWTINMLNLLENHFKENDFLLGSSPTVGDFGLVGPLIPHLARDPYPKENLLNSDKYPFICKWMDRMKRSDNNFSDCDEIPDTLNPILHHVLNEFVPMMNEMVPHVNKLKECPKFYKLENGKNTVSKALPRRLDDIEILLGNSTYKRGTLPFNLYKMQIVLDEYNKMCDDDKKKLKTFLQNYNSNILELEIPRLERVNVRVKFA